MVFEQIERWIFIIPEVEHRIIRFHLLYFLGRKLFFSHGFFYGFDFQFQSGCFSRHRSCFWHNRCRNRFYHFHYRFWNDQFFRFFFFNHIQVVFKNRFLNFIHLERNYFFFYLIWLEYRLLFFFVISFGFFDFRFIGRNYFSCLFCRSGQIETRVETPDHISQE